MKTPKPNPEYRIEKGIPIPAYRQARAALTIAIRKLEPGESLLVTDQNPTQIRSRVNYARTVFKDRQFTTRQMDGGMRVWRTK